MYTFATLDPRQANNQTFDSAEVGVYGIEVTVPALAARCTLGNLDPQHTDGLNMSACKAALDCPIPAPGATLVTNRPDADALLAMAVLHCRANDLPIDRGIVDAIDSADCTPRGPWVRDYSPHPLFSPMNWHSMNHRIPLVDRVMRLVDLLGGGEPLPPAEPVDYSNLRAEERDGRYVIIHARGNAGRGANGLGYKYAPVVITENPEFSLDSGEPHLKYGVARWNESHPMDWDGMLEELRSLEPKWGGSGSICGSTQGSASPLSLDQVVAVVERHLT